MSSARSSVLVTGGTLVEGIRIAKGKPREAPKAVVRLEQLARVADVQPVAAGRVAVHGSPGDEPRDEPAGMIGRIALLEITADQRHVCAVVEIRRCSNEGRGRLLGFLDKRNEPFVAVGLDLAVLRHQL